MSRIPQSSSSRSPLKPSTNSPVSNPSTNSKFRTPLRTGVSPTPPSSKTSSGTTNQDTVSSSLSIKEAIALRRAEAKKTQLKAPSNDFISLEDASPVPVPQKEEEDILGRWPIRETIERARSTGQNATLVTVSD